MARQTVQDILRAQRESRDRQYGALQNSYQRNLAMGNEYADQDYALQTLATALGNKLAGKYKSESPEMTAARANDAEDIAKKDLDASIKREMFIYKNSQDLLGEYDPTKAGVVGEHYDRILNGISSNTVGEGEGAAPPESVLTAGPGTFNQDPTIPQQVEGADVFTSGITTPPAETNKAERDAWLRKSRPGDPFRVNSVRGTAVEKDKQLWQLYRESLGTSNRPVFK